MVISGAVILLPYGLQGFLTGQHYRDDPTTGRLMEEWNNFFHVPETDTWDSSGEMPKVLEVIVGQSKKDYIDYLINCLSVKEFTYNIL